MTLPNTVDNTPTSGEPLQQIIHDLAHLNSLAEESLDTDAARQISRRPRRRNLRTATLRSSSSNKNESTFDFFYSEQNKFIFVRFGNPPVKNTAVVLLLLIEKEDQVIQQRISVHEIFEAHEMQKLIGQLKDSEILPKHLLLQRNLFSS